MSGCRHRRNTAQLDVVEGSMFDVEQKSRFSHVLVAAVYIRY